MAQLLVRNIEDEVRDKLRALAATHGRSMEEEVREILRAAVMNGAARSTVGLGSRLVERFAGCDLRDGEIEELRGHPPRPAAFDDPG